MWKFFGICWIIFLPGGGTIPYSKYSRMVVSFNVLAKNIIYIFYHHRLLSSSSVVSPVSSRKKDVGILPSI